MSSRTQHSKENNNEFHGGVLLSAETMQKINPPPDDAPIIVRINRSRVHVFPPFPATVKFNLLILTLRRFGMLRYAVVPGEGTASGDLTS